MLLDAQGLVVEFRLSPKIAETISRRLFTQRAAAATAVLLVPPTDLEAQQQPDPKSGWKAQRAIHG
jgi:hypothetical protein